MISMIRSLSVLPVAMSLVVFAATSQDVFRNVAAGFEVTKPAGWHFATAAQNLENIKATKFQDDELRAALEKYATAPLVVLTKFEEPYSDLNPSFKVNLKPYGGLKGQQPKDIANLMIAQLGKMFKDYKVVQAPMSVEISGITSAYVRIDYTLESAGGLTFPTTSELWVVPHGDYFFMIGAGTRQDEKTGTRKEIQEILKTVKIEPVKSTAK